ncbi:MAG: hypothetical protein JNL82_37830 [Myxococcales bacterium]|nr:hypothetical protein [Myxococcales bacterium]
MLGVSTGAGSRVLTAWQSLAQVGDAVGDGSPAFVALARQLSGLMLNGLRLANRGPRRVPFRIPTELRQVWGENWR